jgi:RpiB/LacA/LacB family sugar-phosphate isomerase
MRIAVASDHAGFRLSESVVAELRRLKHDVFQLGIPDAALGDDCPDSAEALAEMITSGKCERGVLICGSGVGASVAVNKFRGIRAGLCHDTYSAHQGVEHDHMNVLVLGGGVIGEALANELVRVFISSTYTNQERPLRRLAKISEIEGKHSSDPKPSAHGRSS